MIPPEKFAQQLEQAHIPAGGVDYAQFERYCTLLQEWNQRMNLTAILDDEGIAVKHFIDSLLPLTLCELPPNGSLIDVGAGAGFPSVPMKLLRPDLSITLLDSLEKRLGFLRALCGELGIVGETVHARAEDAGKSALYRERYDVATARAVAGMSLLAEYCLPLVKVGGQLLALKGSGGRAEAAAAAGAIELCGGVLDRVVDYQLPNGDPRTLIIVKKCSPTPAKYPRNSAQSVKNPL